jgi:hypothetical protein
MNTSSDQTEFESAYDRHWQCEFEDSCLSNWEDKWFLDGEIAAVRHRTEGMELCAGPRKHDAHHMVLWTKNEYAGDLKIEFNYTRTDFALDGVNIIYIQARGAGQAPYHEDISSWNNLRATPSMACYHDFMDTYHVSYATGPGGGDDYVRARRYLPQLDQVADGLGKGLENTDLKPDYFKTGLFHSGQRHCFCIIKRNQQISMKISNDEKTSFFHWKNKQSEDIHQGRIGIRHMFTRSAIYSDFKISVGR